MIYDGLIIPERIIYKLLKWPCSFSKDVFISVHKFQSIMKSLNNGKAADSDKIVPEHLKFAPQSSILIHCVVPK